MVLILASGGADSTLLQHWAAALLNPRVVLLFVDYGQPAALRELATVQRNMRPTDLLRVAHLPLRVEGAFRGDGPCVVPARNLGLLACAVNAAEVEGCSEVWIGCNDDDRIHYPDCTEQFIERMRAAAVAATDGRVSIQAPLIERTKRQIVHELLGRGIVGDDLWVCYRGGPSPCLECFSCRSYAQALR